MTLPSQRQSWHSQPPSLRRRRKRPGDWNDATTTTTSTTTTTHDDTGPRPQRHHRHDATLSLLSSFLSRIGNVLLSGVSSSSSPPWMMIAIILVLMVVVAVVVMVVTNNQNASFSHHHHHRNHRNHSVSIMLQSFCHHHHPNTRATTKCHFSLGLDRPDGRRVTAQIDAIPAYQTVLRISKGDTIWDIDAIQDPWIQQVQQQLHHSGTVGTNTTGLLADAYLSLYLARCLFHPPQSHHTATQSQEQKHHFYFATLPRHVHEFHDHPLFWTPEDVSRRLGTFTVAYHSVRQLQHMIQWEYDIFLPSMAATMTLSSKIDMPIILSFDQYRIARVNVLSRSFGTGPIPWASDAELQVRLINVQSYVPHLNFSNGHHVMVPLLDQLNHHGQDYNVDFTYDFRNQSFVVRSNTMIPFGHEILDHYGKHTSSHLFAKYGFINYDSSDYSEATIALWHNLPVPYRDEHHNNNAVVVPEERKYRMQMLRYLQYDDGYHTCIGDPRQLEINGNSMPRRPFFEAAWKLKQWKYKILLSMLGRQSSHWVIHMSPARSPRSTTTDRGGRVTPSPPRIKSEQVQQLLSTCRLLVLRHDDFSGTAMDVLSQLYKEQSFYLSSPFLNHNVDGKEDIIMASQHDDDKRSNALEFRTYMCLARMIQTAMMRFPRSTVSKQWEYIAETLEPFMSTIDDDGKNEYVTTTFRRNWTIAHLHYSELQALETLKQIVFSHLRQHYSEWMSTVVTRTDRDMIQSHNDTTLLYTMRDEPCTFQQYLQPLLNL